MSAFQNVAPRDIGPTPGDKSRGKSVFRPAAIEKCHVCAKTVYAMEKIVADDVVFHKNCLKCSECQKTLGLGNYASLAGKYFCKPHFKQLFMAKGNYSEGRPSLFFSSFFPLFVFCFLFGTLASVVFLFLLLLFSAIVSLFTVLVILIGFGEELHKKKWAPQTATFQGTNNIQS